MEFNEVFNETIVELLMHMAFVYIFLGMDHLGDQCEKPFGDDASDLPMEEYCGTLSRTIHIWSYKNQDFFDDLDKHLVETYEKQSTVNFVQETVPIVESAIVSRFNSAVKPVLDEDVPADHPKTPSTKSEVDVKNSEQVGLLANIDEKKDGTTLPTIEEEKTRTKSKEVPG